MKHRTPSRSASRQRGVVLLFSLIALVVLLIGAVALMRSFNSSLFMSGNIAFKRDLQNQGERAMNKVLAKFQAGGPLETTGQRAIDSPTNNYSAMMLPANAQGIPLALQSDANFNAKGAATNDITPTSEPSLRDQGVSVRYIVDRMCNATGDETVLGAANCLLADGNPPPGTSASNMMSAGGASLGGNKPANPLAVVYRLTVRVQGPRDTQAFFQSTFTVPS